MGHYSITNDELRITNWGFFNGQLTVDS